MTVHDIPRPFEPDGEVRAFPRPAALSLLRRIPRPSWPRRAGTAITAPAAPAAAGVLLAFRHAALYAVAAVITAASAASFAESYRGLYQWASRHGLAGMWAAGFPLQVDSFIAVGELVLFIAMVDGWPARARAGAWTVTLLGLAVSVAGNIGHVTTMDFQSRATAAVPPLAAFMALWVGLSTLKRVVSQRRETVPATTPATGPASPEPADAEVAGTAEDAAKMAYARSVRGGNPLSERALSSRFGIPRSHIKKLLAEVAEPSTADQPAADLALN